MTSINTNPTFYYSQPGGYNFSHDSVFLAYQVFEIIKKDNTKPKDVLDLCAGCGVVGLDLLYHLSKSNITLPETVDFLEIQNVYRNHLMLNFETLKTHLLFKPQINFLNLNYADIAQDLKFKNKYDLIVSNPPYFRAEHGKLSPNEFKNRCRFFIDSDYSNLIKSIEFSLKPSGKAYVLLKSLQEHSIDIEKEFHSISSILKLKNIGTIRDTSLYCITKHI